MAKVFILLKNSSKTDYLLQNYGPSRQTCYFVSPKLCIGHPYQGVIYTGKAYEAFWSVLERFVLENVELVHYLPSN